MSLNTQIGIALSIFILLGLLINAHMAHSMPEPYVPSYTTTVSPNASLHAALALEMAMYETPRVSSVVRSGYRITKFNETVVAIEKVHPVMSPEAQIAHVGHPGI